MAVKHATFHDFFWDYTFPLPYLDRQQDFRTQQKGSFSRLVGVDGRYTGRLKKFPGFKLKESMTLGTVTVDGDNTSLFKPFAIQKCAGGTNVIRGVIFLGQDGGSDKLYAYWSEDDGSSPTVPALSVIHTFGSGAAAPAFLDFTMDHQLLYVTGETAGVDGTTKPEKIELLARYAGSTAGAGWNSATWDSSSPDQLDFEDLSVADLRPPGGTWNPSPLPGHLVPNEEYGFTYRFVYPDQGFVGALSSPLVFNAEGGAGAQSYDAVYRRIISGISPVSADVFTRAVVQLFRTTNTGYGDAAVRGQLLLEAEYEIPRVTEGSSGNIEGTFTASTGYTESPPSITVTTGAITDVAVGDILYLSYPIRTYDSLDAGVDSYEPIVFRRTVTGKSGGPDTISFDKHIGPVFTGAFACSWWISKQGDGDRTDGAFVAVGSTLANPPVPIGWRTLEGAYPSDMPTGLRDQSLAMQPRLRPEEFSTFRTDGNPPARFIREYENLFVYVTRAGRQLGSAGQDVMRWSPTEYARKGLIPVLNRRILSDLTDEVLDVVKADPFLVVMLNNGLLRIHRSGSRLAVDPIHNRFGTVSGAGTVSVGSNLFFVSEVGILVANLPSSQVDVMNATQHFFDEAGSGQGNWRDNLSSVQAAYDAQLSALMFLNAVKSELLIIWLNHGVLTHLIDVPFDRLITSGDLRTGGLRRALFFSDTAAKFYEIDADRSAPSRTTFSFTGESGMTYNGLAGTGSGDTLLKPPDGYSGSPFDNTNEPLIGHFVRIFEDASGNWKATKKITGYSGQDLVVESSVVPALVAGDRFALGAIPLQITAWPLHGGTPELPVSDLIRLKKATSMGAVVANLSGDTAAANPNLLLKYQLYERDESAAAVSTEGIIDADETAQTFAAVQKNNAILVPGVECWSSNLDFDLLGLVVRGKIEGSMKDTRA